MVFMRNNLGRSPSVAVGEINAIQFTTILIGKQIKAMREQAGLSQSEVARNAHTRPETISRLENGSGNPTVTLVERIVRAINKLAS